MSNYNKALRIIKQVFKPSKVQIHTRMKSYRRLVRSTLCYGSEAWTIHIQNERRITAVGNYFNNLYTMNFLKKLLATVYLTLEERNNSQTTYNYTYYTEVKNYSAACMDWMFVCFIVLYTYSVLCCLRRRP